VSKKDWKARTAAQQVQRCTPSFEVEQGRLRRGIWRCSGSGQGGAREKAEEEEEGEANSEGVSGRLERK
jgi:hypothetical protein